MWNRLNHSLKYRQALYQIRKAGIWFVDIPRTSSSSIKVELQQTFGNAFGKSDIIDSAFNIKDQPMPNHLPAREMYDRLGAKAWNELFTFSVVRNPWDRMLSLYKYRQEAGELKQVKDYASYLELFFESAPLHLDSPFHYHGHYFQCADYLVDNNGQLMVDLLIRYENRQQGLLKLQQHFTQLNLGKLHLNQSLENGPYRKHYNSHTRQLVAAIAKKDIDLFGYEF